MTSYLFAVTTHAIHLMSLIKPLSSLQVTHRTDLMVVDRFLNLFGHRFYVIVLFFRYG